MNQRNDSPEKPHVPPPREPERKPDIIEEGVLPPEDRTPPPPSPDENK